MFLMSDYDSVVLELDSYKYGDFTFHRRTLPPEIHLWRYQDSLGVWGYY
jgi:hypothetical protein